MSYFFSNLHWKLLIFLEKKSASCLLWGSFLYRLHGTGWRTEGKLMISIWRSWTSWRGVSFLYCLLKFSCLCLSKRKGLKCNLLVKNLKNNVFCLFNKKKNVIHCREIVEWADINMVKLGIFEVGILCIFNYKHL